MCSVLLDGVYVLCIYSQGPSNAVGGMTQIHNVENVRCVDEGLGSIRSRTFEFFNIEDAMYHVLC